VLENGIIFTTPDTLQTGNGDAGTDTAFPVGGVDPGAWSKQLQVVFLPNGTAQLSNGTAQPALEIALQGSGGRPIILKLRSLTCTVTARNWGNEDQP